MTSVAIRRRSTHDAHRVLRYALFRQFPFSSSIMAAVKLLLLIPNSLPAPAPACHAQKIHMMDRELDLQDFSNLSKLFPLPNFVMFPHVIVPLHIFEPRYRQMTADALAGDKLVTMIQIRQPEKGKQWAEPVPLEDVGCLGRIIKHDRLADGRYHILLLGLKRVRLRQEVPSGKLPHGPGRGLRRRRPPSAR